MLHAYYLDQPLTDAEVAEVEKALAHAVGPRRTGTPPLEQVLVPGPWPEVDPRTLMKDTSATHLRLAKKNLQRAGIHRDHARLVGIIMPRDPDYYWASMCAWAIWELTGEHPFAVRPWIASDDGPVRGMIQIVGLPIAVRPTEGG